MLLKEILAAVLKFGVEWLEKYQAENEAELEAFVKEKCPGEAFDALAWEAVKGAVPVAFAALKKAIEEIGGAAVVASMSAEEIDALASKVAAESEAA